MKSYEWGIIIIFVLWISGVLVCTDLRKRTSDKLPEWSVVQRADGKFAYTEQFLLGSANVSRKVFDTREAAQRACDEDRISSEIWNREYEQRNNPKHWKVVTP